MWNWFTRLISGEPHFVIGGRDRPYMLRWYVIPRNPLVNVYLHKFMRDDDDRALHDHPWNFLSIMLWGSYREHRDIETRGSDFTFFRSAEKVRGWLSIAYRRATDRHRVTLRKSLSTGNPIPCWTLVITGPRVRDWGFWCPQGFVPWQTFVAKDDDGAVGRGCGET